MIIQRLSWAGILIKFKQTTILVDPLYHINTEFFGYPHETFYSFHHLGHIDAVLITHLHSDHFDPKAIASFLGSDIPVYVPKASLKEAQRSILNNIIGIEINNIITCGSLEITATHSVDGLRDPQIAWIIKAEDKRLIHCGDTLWHGYWWKISKEHRPFDVACLPVNGATIHDSDLTPTDQPICLTPEQAVSAAVILGAKKLIPIHFGAFHHPPQYTQTPKLMERLHHAASSNHICLHVMKTHDILTF